MNDFFTKRQPSLQELNWDKMKIYNGQMQTDLKVLKSKLITAFLIVIFKIQMCLGLKV